jgi:hypothetical protein
MQSIRYAPELGTNQTLNASPPNYCWGSSSPSTSTGPDGAAVSVWCSTVWNPTSTVTRVVTLVACPAATAASSCAVQPGLEAVITLDDYPAGGGTPTTSECVSTCGDAMVVDSWLWAGRS